jgi:hypothetical protein
MLKSRRKENVDFRKYVSYLWALVAETLVKVNNIIYTNEELFMRIVKWPAAKIQVCAVQPTSEWEV